MTDRLISLNKPWSLSHFLEEMHLKQTKERIECSVSLSLSVKSVKQISWDCWMGERSVRPLLPAAFNPQDLKTTEVLTTNTPAELQSGQMCHRVAPRHSKRKKSSKQKMSAWCLWPHEIPTGFCNNLPGICHGERLCQTEQMPSISTYN